MKQDQLEPLVRVEQLREICNCSPLLVAHCDAGPLEEQGEIDLTQFVPVTRNMKKRLYTTLDTFFPRSTPLSLLLLHVAQLEPASLLDEALSSQRPYRYHANPGLLQQILVNVRRAIRQNDALLVHKGVGAAILFPETDQWGASAILERVYDSISLLQSETVIPPLVHETIIAMGIATYPEPCSSLEQLLEQSGSVERSLTLRPVVTAQVQAARATVNELSPEAQRSVSTERSVSAAPFMRLPKALPLRLQQLLPYQVAVQLRCIPVGREQRALTVAMAHPLNLESRRRLQEITGMSIFPVFCREEELSALLADSW